MNKQQLIALSIAIIIAGCHQSSMTSPIVTNPSAATNKVPVAWAGTYLVRSNLCTTPETNASCALEFEDCLSIRRSSHGYHVELHSTQASQHTCSFQVEMKESKDGNLVFQSAAGPVSIVRRKDAIEIESPGIDPTALGLGFCGAHADIDGIIFPLMAKTDIRKPCVPAD